MEGVFWLGLFGLAFLVLDVFCIRKLADYFHLKKQGIECMATIIKLDERWARTSKAYYPVYQFKAQDGIVYTIVSESGMSYKYKKYSVGKKLKVYYDAENPYHHIIARNDLYTRIALVFLVTLFTVLFLGMSIGFAHDILTR